MEHEPKVENDEIKKDEQPSESEKKSLDLTPEEIERLYAKEDDDHVKGQW